MTLPRYYLTTNLIPSAYFCFKVNSKNIQGQGCLTTGKKSFVVFCCKNLKWKRSKCQLFCLASHWPASFLPSVNDASQIVLRWWPYLLSYELTLSLLYCGIFTVQLQTTYIKMSVLVIFYCQNLLWHVILGRMFGI